MLNSEASCRQYLEEQDAATVARQILHDQKLCRSQRLPSLLVLYMPSSSSKLGLEIAYELYPDNRNQPRSIASLQYSGIVQGIKAYLNQMTPSSKHGPLPFLKPTLQTEPSKEELETALKVLEFYLRGRDHITINTSVGHVIQAIKNEKAGLTKGASMSEDSSTALATLASPFKPKAPRNCYICRFSLVSSHPQYPSLCQPCGSFNLASCSISLPENLNLKGRTAFVTGGRVNLGFHTALGLLRCGAKVIASTRYPRDAESRYMAKHDFHEWSHSLKIIGADFRAASDVFHMIVLVKDCLSSWDEKGAAKLDILINNAAQTLTDPLDTETKAVAKEEKLRIAVIHGRPSLALEQDSYAARVRGGVQSSNLVGAGDNSHHITPGSYDDSTIASCTGEVDAKSAPALTAMSSISVKPSTQSSWMQSINQIPYEDIISAHSVNTFVPLILVRELLPLMGSTETTTQTASNRLSKPLAYIVNVSSREGIFESNPNSSAKQGHHVHTNLTKAALNMLTETEAGPAWTNSKVAMNTVDPGYMSAAPEITKKWKDSGREGCPIGWEDGVGRVLWPIAAGEQGNPVWGRFLKHFGSVDVDVGTGR